MRTDSNASSNSRAKSHARSSRDVSPLREPQSPPTSSQTDHRANTKKWRRPYAQATNFQTVHYRMPISGTYIIDPRLEMPADLIHGHPTKKSNLSLECTRGSITADVWLVDELGAPMGLRNRAVLDVHCNSWMGKVDLNLYSVSPLPYSLSVSSNGGDISVALPPDFVGPITLSTGSFYDLIRPSSFTPLAPSRVREIRTDATGQTEVSMTPYSTSIVFSKAVKSRLVTFSEDNGKRTCFIGDYRSARYTTRKDWAGSMVDIQSAYGNLKVSFVDEQQEQEQASGCIVM